MAAAAAFRAPLDLTKSQKLKARGKHRAVREERAPQPPALGASVTLRAFKHKTNLNGQRGVVVGFDDGLLASDDSRLAAAAAAEPAERCTVRLEDGRRVKNLKVRNLERRSPRHKSYCSGWSALPPQPPWEPTVELQVRRRILEHQHARTSGSHREEVLRAVRRHRGVKDLRHPTDPASTSASTSASASASASGRVRGDFFRGKYHSPATSRTFLRWDKPEDGTGPESSKGKGRVEAYCEVLASQQGKLSQIGRALAR